MLTIEVKAIFALLADVGILAFRAIGQARVAAARGGQVIFRQALHALVST
jgi:hypothetical protein